MDTTHHRPVVAGVDGSPESHVAVDLAAKEARWRGCRLRLVHAFVWPTLGVYTGPSPEGPPDGGLAAEADRVLAEAVERARKADPGLEVSGEVVTGAPVPVLLTEANRAELLVIGDRGLGGFAGLLLGSVAIQLATHAAAPIMVARGEQRTDGPVVVGVDGPASSAAIEFAVAEAAARAAEVLAVHVWHGRLPHRVEDELPLIYDEADVRAVHERELAELVAPARQRHPGVVVREDVRHGRPARTLVELSRQAQLVVVGARGRGGFTGLLLGSTSQSLLHHAECPVAVVRD